MTITSSYEQKYAATLSGILLAPFRAFGRLMIILAEASSHGKALERLNRISDAELASKGLTRESEIRRILGVSYAI